MAKMKNEDYIRDATEIADRLDAVENLNASSTAILKVCRAYLKENDGRFAFTLATRADVMHGFSRMRS